MQLPSFPKIFSIGSKQTERLFNGEVEITEKLDGSQIGFGVINGELIIRSKGAQIFPETVDKMFKKAVEVITERKEILVEGAWYYGEYLSKPKHNSLEYGMTPLNHIALYGIYNFRDGWINYEGIKLISRILELDVVPLLYRGLVHSVEELKANLDRKSALGGANIEGIVVKNYKEQLLIGGQVIPLLMGKYVSEAFKEVNKTEWKANSGKSKWENYKQQYCSEARWEKAIQYLRDCGQLLESPKDIGSLLKRVNEDIEVECKEDIKEFLWKEFGHELLRVSTKNLPCWYKDKLLNNQNMGNNK